MAMFLIHRRPARCLTPPHRQAGTKVWMSTLLPCCQTTGSSQASSASMSNAYSSSRHSDASCRAPQGQPSGAQLSTTVCRSTPRGSASDGVALTFSLVSLRFARFSKARGARREARGARREPSKGNAPPWKNHGERGARTGLVAEAQGHWRRSPSLAPGKSIDVYTFARGQISSVGDLHQDVRRASASAASARALPGSAAEARARGAEADGPGQGGLGVSFEGTTVHRAEAPDRPAPRTSEMPMFVRRDRLLADFIAAKTALDRSLLHAPEVVDPRLSLGGEVIA
ncbi:hypothetical protein [Azospirillum melinis]